MSTDRVIIVHLRRPKSDASEKRSDPFWEFASFGITGCHGKNLMNPNRQDRLSGVRLAFAQGGKEGTRLVYLTPPVEIVHHGGRLEAKWSPPEKPFRYRDAPVLASNKASSDFPRLEASFRAANRKENEGKFSSCYRNRTSALEETLAKEIIAVYNRRRKQANNSAFARCYADALPWNPPNVDGDRLETYTEELAKARDSKSCVGDPKSATPRSSKGRRKGRC